MPRAELEHLELLSEIDSLSDALKRWADARAAVASRARPRGPWSAVCWNGCGGCELGWMPLLWLLRWVELGLEKDACRNPAGRSRDRRGGTLSSDHAQANARLLSRYRPPPSGYRPGNREVVQRNLPNLANLVLLDCPDPDTTEETGTGGTNLARLRQILPHCDVLLVATTQQKYRSARVAEELAAAASGARLVFVQTHGDQDPESATTGAGRWSRGTGRGTFSSSIRWPRWRMPRTVWHRGVNSPGWWIC